MRALLGINPLNIIAVPFKKVSKQFAASCYLACSWTWCIGMFLPVILQKDFGAGGWLFFVICNVVGATAFAWVVSDAKRSRVFIDQNLHACRWFSRITIAFQLFFIGWVCQFLSTSVAAALLISIAIFLVLKKYLIPVSIIVYFGSLVFLMLATQDEQSIFNALKAQIYELDPRALEALPILALGFFLCPYLDITFHKIIQKQEIDHVNYQASFLVGFGALFFLLMMFSLWYVDTAKQMVLSGKLIIPLSLCVYFVLQAGFTVAAHLENWQQSPSIPYVLVTLIFPVIGFWMPGVVNEWIYRGFLSFYGVIFPAYLWLKVFNPFPISNKALVLTVILALLILAGAMWYQWTILYPMAAALIMGARFLPAIKGA